MDLFAPLKAIFDFVSPLFESVPFIRVTLGIIIVFFLPGFAWTMVFFRQLKPIERIPISLALSMVLVTLSMIFVSRLFGTNINGFNSLITIGLITILPVAYYYLKKKLLPRKSD